DGRGQLHRAQLPRLAPGAVAARLVLPRRRDAPAHRDLAVADPRDADAEAAGLHGFDGPRLPARHDRRDALPDLPPVRGASRRPRDYARRPEGNASEHHAPALRPRAARALPDALLPVHRALDGTGRILHGLRRRRLPDLQALRLDRDGRLGRRRPGGARVLRDRPRGVLGLRVRKGSRAPGPPPPRRPRTPLPRGGRPTLLPPVLGARVKAPISWLRDYVPIEMPLPELAERLAVSTCEVDQITHRGVPDVDGNLG